MQADNKKNKISNKFKILNSIRKSEESKATKLKAQKNNCSELVNFFDLAFELLCITDEKGFFKKLNPEWENVFGFKLKTFKKKCLSDFVHPADEENTKKLFNRRRSKNCVLQTRFRCKDRTYKWIEWHVRHYHKLVYIVGWDVTSRKNTEENLKDNENFLNNIVENIPNMIFVKDAAKLRFVRFNKAGENLLGYKREQLYGKNDYDFFPKKQAIWFINKDRDVLNSGKLLDIREEFINTGHGQRILHTKKIPIFDESGKPKYLLGISEDITDKIKVEEALKESEITLQATIDAVSESVFLIDTKGIVLSSNETSSKRFRVSKKELLGKNIFDLFPETVSELRKSYITKTIKDRIPLTFEDKRDGRWIENTVYPLIEDSRVTKVAIYGRDVTQRKIFEQELSQSKIAAEAANKAKSEFLANMSHEIRTPMNAILGFAELLKNKVSDEVGIDYLNGIATGGKNLMLLINDVLDLSKIEAGKLEIQYEPVNLKNIVNELKQIFIYQAQKKGIELKMEVNPDLPKFLGLDHIRIRQVLLNLIGNALKFTHHGFIKVKVDTLEIPNDTSKLNLYFEVEDSGVGIAPDQLQKIFEAFYQSREQSTQRIEGTGLGLTITKRLVEMMNGNISIKSRQGKGSSFRVELNNVSISVIHNEETSEEVNSIPAGLVFNDAKILLVEDVESNRKIIKGFLENYNLQIIEAYDGEHAIQMLKQVKPELILMDIQMPEMDGNEATALIKQKKDWKLIPIIALTASSSKADISQLKAMFDFYLQKPVGRSLLITTLMKFLKYTVTQQEQYEESEIRRYEAGIKEYKNSGEIIDVLETKYLPLISILKSHKIINNILELADELDKFGKDNKIDVVSQYAKELSKTSRSFDILKIDKILDNFESLITVLKKNKT